MLRDAVYGAAVGDALGVPYEFRERGTFRCVGMDGHGTHGQPAGTWSDDTSLLIATCDSFRELGRVDCGDIGARFRAWLDHGAYSCGGVFDVGATTARAIHAGRGMDGERDNGNGSLMRIAPLAYFGSGDAEVGGVSAITHGHATSRACCALMVRTLRRIAATGDAGRALGPMHAALRATPPSAVRSGGYVEDTMDAALWCLANTDSYAGCVLAAVNLGGDTDTTACVAGALAGELYGLDAIPEEWVGALRRKDLIGMCIEGIGGLTAV